MPDIKYDQWFRTKVLPIVADKDEHVIAATSAVALALATGKLDVCVQGLFSAGKSRAAAISFVEMVHYLEFPTELYQRIGRIVSDTEAQKTSSTYFDIRHSAKAERLF